MSATIRDTAFQLRQGKLIALADETGWSVAADPIHDAAVGQLLAFQSSMPTDRQPTVVIQNTDQLGLYVAKVPEIAFDLVEFAENPLVVVYGQGKNVSSKLIESQSENERGSIAVRRSLNSDVQRLIGGFGRGLLTIPFESLLLNPATEATVIERFGNLPASLKKPRIMRLGPNGEVAFIRK